MNRPIQIGIVLAPNQYRKYKLATTDNGTNMSDPIREFIDKYIVAYEKKIRKPSLVD